MAQLQRFIWNTIRSIPLALEEVKGTYTETVNLVNRLGGRHWTQTIVSPEGNIIYVVIIELPSANKEQFLKDEAEYHV